MVNAQIYSTTTVKDLLEKKGDVVWTVTPETPLKKALQIMAAERIGAVLVLEGGKTIGIFSERDYAHQMATTRHITMLTPVKELMTHPIFYVTPAENIEACLALMTSKRFRHLPVIDGDRLVGIISIGDIVKQIITEREVTINDLEHYIWVNMI